MTKNDITGDPIKSRASSDAYRDGWSLIFENKVEADPIRVNPDLIIRYLSDESVIFDQKNGVIHNLNETATRIFFLACSPYATINSVVDDFLKEHECEDLNEAKAAVIECIENLKQKGILKNE